MMEIEIYGLTGKPSSSPNYYFGQIKFRAECLSGSLCWFLQVLGQGRPQEREGRPVASQSALFILGQ